MIVFGIPQRELALGVHMSPPSSILLPPPSPPSPLGYYRGLALGSLGHTSDSHWLSVLHIVIITNKGPSNQSYGFSSNHVWM